MSTLGWPLSVPQERGMRRGAELLESHGISVPQQDLERGMAEALARLADDLAGASAFAEEMFTMNLTLGVGAHLSTGEPFPLDAEMGLREILRRIFNGLW